MSEKIYLSAYCTKESIEEPELNVGENRAAFLSLLRTKKGQWYPVAEGQGQRRFPEAYADLWAKMIMKGFYGRLNEENLEEFIRSLHNSLQKKCNPSAKPDGEGH